MRMPLLEIFKICSHWNQFHFFQLSTWRGLTLLTVFCWRSFSTNCSVESFYWKPFNEVSPLTDALCERGCCWTLTSTSGLECNFLFNYCPVQKAWTKRNVLTLSAFCTTESAGKVWRILDFRLSKSRSAALNFKVSNNLFSQTFAR